MIANTHYGFCGGAVSTLEGNFTYTGSYNLRSDGVLELLTSGTFTPKKKMTIDVFLVGGGGAGAMLGGSTSSRQGGGGGGGGYTSTHKQITVETATTVTIGTGGVGSSLSSKANDGNPTTFGNYTANGGEGAGSTQRYYGGNGGSGGGSGAYTQNYGGNGGDNGTNGTTNNPSEVPTSYGVGQGTTTREFGEANGKLYAGGGGGGAILGNTPGTGGSGGGNGGYGSTSSTLTGANGTSNTGGGGGGAGAVGYNVTNIKGGSGGTGIVCVRLAA